MRGNEPVMVTSAHPEIEEARALMDRLDAELHDRYPQSSIHGFEPGQIADGSGAFLVARLAGRAVGCGAVRPLEAGVGEVKRMFVLPECRGRGIARQLLSALETAAAQLGFHTLRLETGTRQPEAIGLYESAGYVKVPPYGEYVGDPFSVCYEKRLPEQS
jgi:GNAT superfamily N-acetyltransferase